MNPGSVIPPQLSSCTLLVTERLVTSVVCTPKSMLEPSQKSEKLPAILACSKIHLGGLIAEHTTGDPHVVSVQRTIRFTAGVQVQDHDRHFVTGQNRLANLVEAGHRDKRACAVRAVCSTFGRGVMVVELKREIIVDPPLEH